MYSLEYIDLNLYENNKNYPSAWDCYRLLFNNERIENDDEYVLIICVDNITKFISPAVLHIVPLFTGSDSSLKEYCYIYGISGNDIDKYKDVLESNKFSKFLAELQSILFNN